MKKLLLFFLLPLNLLAQNTIGLPDVINYGKQVYNAGLQNWDIKQDKNGIIYIANNEGLLTFDGSYWNLFPLPNKTIVRSIEIGDDGKIYVGGQDELGYFFPERDGKLAYHTLVHLINAKDKSFGDVWDIVSFHHTIFFRTANQIFKFTDKRIISYRSSSEWSFLGFCNDKLYAHEYSTGLKVFENNIWVPLLHQNELPLNNPVTSILPSANGQAIISTLKNGLFRLTNIGISRVSTPNQMLFESERIYSATAVNKNWIALATSNAGIYIIDHKGNIVQSISKMEGLQNNNVLNIFVDQQQNLWLGLDNGVDFIAYNSAIKQINPFLRNASGYTALIHDNNLFLGTSNGLYRAALKEDKDLSFNKSEFIAIQNTKGQVWGLSRINNQLLLGHHEGAFMVKNNVATSISSVKGYWNFIPTANNFPTAQMVAGTYNGLMIFNSFGQSFTLAEKIPNFLESSRFIAIDNEGQLWISHPYHGVYKIIKQASKKFSIHLYNQNKGLPSAMNNHVYKIKNEILIATEKGVFVYDKQKDKFKISVYYQKLLGNLSLRYLKEDELGNIWFIHEKELGVIDFSQTTPQVIYVPELNNKMLSGFEFIYPINPANILIGGEKGFFNINYEKYKQTSLQLKVAIRNVRIIDQSDSLLFGGYYHPSAKAASIPKLANAWKTIRFQFSSPSFASKSNIEYSFKLKGFDNKWSAWAKRTEKEYTNLPAGDYTFQVKVKNNLGQESEISAFAFAMLPPWYQSVWAKLFYFALFITAMFGLNLWQKRKLKLQQQKHQSEQEKILYIHSLEINKTESELVALRNEKLEADLNLMHSELASSAMHLVKKAELLTKSKEELSKIMKVVDHPQVVAELKKMMRSLNEDDKMDQEWENFTKHFDKVHGGFLNVLREKHPKITPNELKLCAYLRMNLTTKEIAQLINISVRGVEIGRYRLRKKLEIPSEMNLFDYLISIKTS